VPEPLIEPGLIVHVPAGRPLNVMLPVAIPQSGCVTELIVGAEGVTGWVLITIFAEAEDIQPAAFVIV